ncbi:major facilitator superfamily domain-containing protein [Mycena metata]|uniref:Major facilitator superfamily domain-containing protein n=1 Tax=Mycena metata TaxID=1033252 RepID=A0AAD7P3E9_9AGAR|nr:major facilitator superfamily domain-containing protein [Mycena metata]
MSLQPIAVELCQGSALRGRRRSSIRPQNFLPLPFTSGVPPDQNESAVADEAAPPDRPFADASPAPLTLIHTSGHLTSFSTSRHHDALSTHKSDITASPSDSAASTDTYFELKPAPGKDSRLKWRVASVIFLYFLNGWGDGVTGTALPYFRAEFHLSYMTSSLLFVGTTCGFTSGTLFLPHIMAVLGHFYLSDPKLALRSPFRIALSRPSPKSIGHSAVQARSLVVLLFSIGSPISFIMMGSKQGLPTMFMAYIVLSFARAVLTAPLNSFMSEGNSKRFGYAFGFWSLGAVASPLIFQLTAAAGLPWSHFYFGSLVLTAANFMFLSVTFYPTALEFAIDRKNALAQADSRAGRSPPPTPDTDDVPDSSNVVSNRPPPANQLRLLSRMPYQWAVSVFALLYCGSETTTQGLVVQYLLAERSGNPHTAGYVTSGFWAGVTISRIAWSYFSSSITFTGRKYIIQAAIGAHCFLVGRSFLTFTDVAPALALGMQLLIWLYNSNIENAVSASLIGLFFGPIFPACLELANDLLPVELKMLSMAIISASGSLGSAIFPFITGVITTRYSMRDWSYITVTQAVVLSIAWSLFPTRQPVRQPMHRAVAL